MIIGIIIGVSIIAYIVYIVLIVVALVVGPGKDDVVLFYGKKYVIAHEYDRYDLHIDTGEIILPYVRAYLIGEEKSYVRNSNTLITIDENDGRYTQKLLSDLTDAEKIIVEKMELLKSKPDNKRPLKNLSFSY